MPNNSSMLIKSVPNENSANSILNNCQQESSFLLSKSKEQSSIDIVSQNLKNLKLVNDDESFIENSYVELNDLDLKSINHFESLRLMLLRKILTIVCLKQGSNPKIQCHGKF